MAARVYIFDTTLRDGEQSPGGSMNVSEKLELAVQLERLGVDVIEAGFPIASEQEFEGVRRVGEEIRKPRIAALARAVTADIERAAAALEPAANPVLHTFIATSDIHLEHKLRMSREQVIERTGESVRLAKSLVGRVEFSAEDATRSDLAYLAEVAKVAIEAGADVINLPDTVGYTTPGEIEEMFRYVIARCEPPENVVFSSHNHNDLGLAVANALAAIRGGARQVECTVNGIGERAGNTSLEEVVMAMRVRNNVYPYETGIVSEEITNASRLLTNLTGLVVPYNKPIVGRNAFAHEAGIHQHGVLQTPMTYEIMTPESVGVPKNRLVLGKHSGRHAFKKRLGELGMELSEEALSKAFVRFKALCDLKKEVFDEDLLALVEDEVLADSESFTLEHLQFTSGTNIVPTATVRLRAGEEILQESGWGDGPVDAAYKAIDLATKVPGKLMEYQIRAVTGGKDAMGEVRVVVEANGQRVAGRGSSTDVIEASARAYLNAINRVVVRGSASPRKFPDTTP